MIFINRIVVVIKLNQFRVPYYCIPLAVINVNDDVTAVFTLLLYPEDSPFGD